MLLNHLKTLPAFSDNQKEDAVQWLKDITDGLNYAEFTSQNNDYIGVCERVTNCELLEEKEAHVDYSNIKLVELNNIVLLNTWIVENDENNCGMIWPDGCETWFIYDELPQRCQFIGPEKPDVPFNSTSNINDTFSQENLLNCINILSSPVMNDKYIFTSYKKAE
ncbi:unnamed protein product [Rotaria magnacalcarata]|uniref:Uncharacterized protein n=1 Tax=Rotaria magnacalcarata TaxID=392030 RepID=A0A815S7D3_9BILA|nr:unnamed protein product [Rotaria magnacalcarata]CAF1485238.1 unnamed protein product [Rotaria magnacalcarata]CAF2141388.1 unnamed protein product [Rotaria magnacalcarata]CAF4075343.1 unnamed protein product [Rotaria magnacalcarata]CAF4527064.1 unnamed protein product [Rotaria magnacalcarata]